MPEADSEELERPDSSPGSSYCVILVKLVNLSEPEFLCWQKGNNNHVGL